MQGAAAPTAQPFCSVVVPTRGRPDQLVGCVEAIERLDYPHDRFEVIVVDDGGGLAAGYLDEGSRAGPALRIVRQPRRGPAAARNAGARVARGELLAFTDDVCRPDRSWLRLLAGLHAMRPSDALGGFTANALRDNPYATASQLIIDAGYAHYNGDPGAARLLTSNNLAVPRGAFLAIGGFDASLMTSEDRDLCERWIESGRRIAYEGQAVVWHSRHMSLAGFCVQHFAYGRGARAFHRRRTPGYLRRELDLGYYLALPRRPFRREQGDDALAVMLLLPLWQLANAAGYAFERWTERRSSGAQPRPPVWRRRWSSMSCIWRVFAGPSR